VKYVPIIAPPARMQFYTNRRPSSGAEKRWFVYVKPPFGGPAQILRYLGRYIHRTVIHTSPRSRAADLAHGLEWPVSRRRVRPDLPFNRRPN
jgi:hypothetical protein